MQLYHTLKMSSLFEPVILEDVQIKQKYNDHAVIHIEGIAPPELVDQCMLKKLEEKLICLESKSQEKGGNPEVIFCGIILKAERNYGLQ